MRNERRTIRAIQAAGLGCLRIGVMAVVAGLWPAAAYGQPSNWTNPLGGDWTDGANWDAGVPNSSTADPVISVAGTYTVAADNLMGSGVLAGGLTFNTLVMNNAGATLNVTTVNALYAAVGASNALDITDSTINFSGGKLDSTTQFTGTSAGEVSRANVVASGATLHFDNTNFYARQFNLSNDTHVTFGGNANPLMLLRAGSTGDLNILGGSDVVFSGGRFGVRSSRIRMQGGTTAAGRASLLFDGLAYVDSITGNPTNNLLALNMQNTVDLEAGNFVEFRSGAINFSTIQISRRVVSDNNLRDEFLMSGGTASATTINVGNPSTTTGLGPDRGVGLYTQTGGTMTATTVNLGSHVAGEGRGAGIFHQSGGTLSIKDLNLYTDDSAGTSDELGARQFKVTDTAVLTFTGSGMNVVGNANPLTTELMTPGSVDYSGKIVFNPASGVTAQQLLVFGQDVGNNATALTSPTAIGELDLAGLDGAEQLTLTAAGNFTSQALYVNKLVGGLGAAAFLIGDLNLYYNPTTSGFSGTQAFSSGTGSLIALSFLTMGDLNNDTVVNNQDIGPFVLALTDLAAWQTAYPGVDILSVGDINGDLAFNNQDIGPFVTLLTAGSSSLALGDLQNIPEPASLTLLGLGGLLMIGRRRKA